MTQRKALGKQRKEPYLRADGFPGRISICDFRVSVFLTPPDACALPILRSAAVPSPAGAPPAWQSFRAAAPRRWELYRLFFCESPPAAAPRFPESPLADCSARAAALLRNLLRRFLR